MQSSVTAPLHYVCVALVYSWSTAPGHASYAVITSKSLGPLPTSLPATMEDAMAVTLKLSLRYLWIDQVCLCQSDPSDLHSHVARMHMIYNCATLTIVIAARHGSNHGLPGVSTPRIPQADIRLDLLADKPAYVAASDVPRNEVIFLVLEHTSLGLSRRCSLQKAAGLHTKSDYTSVTVRYLNGRPPCR